MIRGSVPPREAQVVEALATGTRVRLNESVRESFSRSGIAHLLAISGLHVGYVALMIYLLVRMTLGRFSGIVSRLPVGRLSAMIALPLVWLYVAFVGFPMSGVRAGLMLSVYFLGVIAGLRQDALTTLAAAVIAVLVAMPLSVLDISFQLSAVAVLGIIVAALPVIRRVDGAVGRAGITAALTRKGLALVAVSASAALFTAPLVAYHFGTFTVLGPITNLVAVPLVALGLMPSILLATLLAPVASWAAGLAFKFSGLLSSVLIDLAERVSAMGSSFTGYVSPTAWEMALAYAAIALLLAMRALPRRFFD
jgi:competence protein ComEC